MPWAMSMVAASVAAFIGRTSSHPWLTFYAVRCVACGVTVCRVHLPGVVSLISNPRPHFYPRNAIVRREFFSAGSSSTLSEDGE